MPHLFQSHAYLRKLHKCCCVWCSAVVFMSCCALVLLGLIIVKPYMHASVFLPSSCTVLNATETLDPAEWKSCSCGQSCSSTYPCLRVMVEYWDTASESAVRSLIHENEQFLHKSLEVIVYTIVYNNKVV